MASPQTENGHIRIANEIWDEIIRRDFSKRQTAILQLIWRLSYGCSKKSATIPKLKYFEVCGVGKQNITKELNYLVNSKVVYWDKGSNIFTFNKDYEFWQISPVKGWNENEFNDLLRLNIKEKFSKQEQNSSQNKNFLADEKNGSSQNKNSKVLKTRTKIQKKFSKQELHFKRIPCGSKDEGKDKYIFKDIIKDIKEKEEEKEPVGDNPFSFYEQNGFGTISPFISDDINYWLDGNFFEEPEQILIKAMEEAILNNARNWKYVNKILLDWSNRKLKTIDGVLAHQKQWELKKLRGDPINRRNPVKQDKLPEWIENQQNQTKESVSDQSSDEQKRKRMEELMQALER